MMLGKNRRIYIAILMGILCAAALFGVLSTAYADEQTLIIRADKDIYKDLKGIHNYWGYTIDGQPRRSLYIGACGGSYGQSEAAVGFSLADTHLEALFIKSIKLVLWRCSANGYMNFTVTETEDDNWTNSSSSVFPSLVDPQQVICENINGSLTYQSPELKDYILQQYNKGDLYLTLLLTSDPPSHYIAIYSMDLANQGPYLEVLYVEASVTATPSRALDEDTLAATDITLALEDCYFATQSLTADMFSVNAEAAANDITVTDVTYLDAMHAVLRLAPGENTHSDSPIRILIDGDALDIGESLETPEMNFEGYYDIRHAGTYDLAAIKSGCDVRIFTTGRVILTQSAYTAATDIRMYCKVDGTDITLNGVNWDNSATSNYQGIAFTGTGNTLTILGYNTIKTNNLPCFSVPAGVQLTLQGTGTLYATTISHAGTIGAQKSAALGDLVFNSGSYHLQNDNKGACIGTGGAETAAAGTITINGGTFDLTGGQDDACIGTGISGKMESITINGGTITATGGHNAAAIGTGYEGYVRSITINGGTITAIGGSHAAGIGSGKNGYVNDINIHGGTIITSSSMGTGLGSGSNSHVVIVNIAGGTLYASGGTTGTGIGSGNSTGDCKEVNISGGLVYASGGDGIDDIGNGFYSDWPADCQVSITGNAVVFLLKNEMADREDDITVPFHGGDTVVNHQVYGFAVPDDWATVGYAYFTDMQPVTGVSLPAYEVWLDVGKAEAVSLAAAVDPAEASNKAVSYLSSDASVATVDAAGIVQSVGVGTATITVTAADGGLQDSCTVYVYQGVTGVTVSPSAQTLYLGDASTANDSVTLSATITPTDAADQAVFYHSDDPSIARVNSAGIVTAVGGGQTNITVTTNDGGYTAVCAITVNQSVTGVTVSPDSALLVLGDNDPLNDTVTLSATVFPDNATDKTLMWESSDTNVATVNAAGVVTARAAGNATITGKTVDGGYTASAGILVKQAATGVSLTTHEAILTLGTGNPGDVSITLNAVVDPPDATEVGLVWESSNTGAATVDSAGVVSAKSTGSTTITVTTASGLFSDSCDIGVYQAVTGVNIVESSATLVLDDGNPANDSVALTGVVEPSTAYQKVTWHADDATIVSVNASGVVTGLEPGQTTVTMTSVQGGLSDSVTVNVVQKVTGISVSPATATLVLGDADVTNDTAQLTAAIEPADATLKTVQWASDDPAVATVDAAGKVTGMGRGEARITATSDDGGYTASCTVTVEQRVTGITLSPTTLTLYLGVDLTRASKALTAAVTPATANNQTIRWESSDPSVAVLNMGMVTGRKAGTATITVTSEDGDYTASCAVRVIQEVMQLNVTPTSATLVLDGATPGLDTLTLQTAVWPETADNKTVTFFSRNPDIATVNAAGVVTAVKAGTATIVASAVSGQCSGMCTVTVEQRVTGVSLAPSAATLVLDDGNPLNDAVSLALTVTPANATNPVVAYTSSNPSVVSVSASGVAKALRAGTATVTATTEDGGYTASCAVTVQQRTTGIALEPQQATLTLGDEDAQNDFAQLTAAVLPGDADNQAVTWVTSDAAVAFVDANGWVRALKKGTATITATSADGSYQAACAVTVEYHVMLSAGGHCGMVCLGNCITLTPSIGGGTWSFDPAAVSCCGNTFTPLRAGTTTVTYSLGPAIKARTLLQTLLESVLRSAAAQSLETASFTITTEPLTLSSSNDKGTVDSGSSVTLTPNFAGGQWTYDTKDLKRNGNTFTALRDSVTTITYTYNGQTAQYTLTVITYYPPTGDGGFAQARLYALLSLAAGLGLLFLRRRRLRGGV